MKTGSEENNQHLESETSFEYSIITEMQEFIEDLTDFLSYALVAKDYKNNLLHKKEMFKKKLKRYQKN
jgi:hypothetical protein